MASRRARYYLGIDIGGTNIRLGIVSSQGKVLSNKRIPTLKEHGKDIVLPRLLKIASSVIKKSVYSVKGIGIGCPGPLDANKGIVLSPPNLPDWKDIPLVKMFKEKFKIPVHLENDANCAGLAESWQGSGKGARSMVLLTLGTGVGSALILNGKLWKGEGFASELGHVSINFLGPRCGCGQKGCLEAYASATAVVRRMKHALGHGKKSRFFKSSVKDITAASIFKAAGRGDKLSKKIVDETGFYLGVAIANIANALNPQVVVLSGGMIKAGKLLFDNIRKTAEERALQEVSRGLKIVPAKLKDEAGMIGAAHLNML